MCNCNCKRHPCAKKDSPPPKLSDSLIARLRREADEAKQRWEEGGTRWQWWAWKEAERRAMLASGCG